MPTRSRRRAPWRPVILLAGLAALALLLPACVALPPAPAGQAAVRAGDLSNTVHYLADPALKGRSPRTFESWEVRRFITQRFEADGLVPWGAADGFEQPFIVGTNVIGVLPGSDPALRDQFVVLSAHYDHLGVKDGEVYRGAADNASGVAALLAVARELSHRSIRPKRSIVFAAFDCEEEGMLGSFAFTAREDFKPAKLAGAVNLDMLGRRFLDTVDDTLFAFGTGDYPKLRSAVVNAGRDQGIRILPLGRDLVGPRSDHAAFEIYHAPWVFFTCGQYSDYHKPTDTPDKLNYAQMVKDVRLITATVLHLADAPKVELWTPPKTGDRQELSAIRFLLHAVLAHPKEASVSEDKIAAFKRLEARAKVLLAAPSYTVAQRDAYAAQLARQIVTVLLGGSQTSQQLDTLMVLRDLYKDCPHVALDGWRDLMRHILRYKPGLFNGTPDFNYDALGLNDRTVRILHEPKGLMRLSLLVPRLTAKVTIGWFGENHRTIRYAIAAYGDCTGTRDQLIDFCLVSWRRHRGNADVGRSWAFALRRLTGKDRGATYEDWLKPRLATLGHVSEKDWLLGLIGSARDRIRHRAMQAALNEYPQAAMPRLLTMIANPDINAYLRAQAIQAVNKRNGIDGLRTLLGVLDDQTPVLFRSHHPAFDSSYPFYEAGLIVMLRKTLTASDKHALTLGHEALDRLQQITGEKLGDKTIAWRDWLNQHAAQFAVSRVATDEHG